MDKQSFARERNPNWKGGRRIDSHGYVQIRVGLDHPMASKTSPYVGEHRLVMAEKLGRWLTSDEIVHHIDEDKQNNHPENLELRDRAAHMRAHYAGKPRPSAAKQPRRQGRWYGVTREPRIPGRRGPAKMPMEAKVWPKIDQSPGPDACHPWMALRNRDGYGKIANGRGRPKLYAHRVVYELVNGSIQDPSLVVRHSCDHPWCCNPRHLLLGTRADNNRDRGERKRGREHRQSGAANHNARLTAEQVAEIRRLALEGLSQTKIAERFGIKQPQVSRIVRGVSWSDD